MTEGMDDICSGTVSPCGSSPDTGQVSEEKAEETGAADDARQDPGEGTVPETDSGPQEEPGEEEGAVPLPMFCCVCIQMDQVNNCLHSEKICILPILACLLSLALCTAGLKWVFVDKIFEYEPPTHLDPKPIGQDPFIISADPTMGLTLSPSNLPLSTSSSSSAFTTTTSGRPEVMVEDKSTKRPFVPLSPKVTLSDSSVTLKYNAEKTTPGKQSPKASTTQGLSSNEIPAISITSTTTTTLKTSSHVTRCSDSQKNYCVNGGECFTLEIMPGSTKFLCRCPNEFTGDRCQNYVMASFYKAEELYQKRILTITGICIALLVVGIMCVVAYCRTKKERKKLHDRLKQSLRRKRKSGVSSTRGRKSSQLALQNLPLPQKNSGEAEETAVEKDTETSVSTSKCALSASEPPTALTHISQSYPPVVPSPATPGSPPSEMSAPLSSLAVSVPSVALSPSVEEERPLLLSNTQQHQLNHHQKRRSAHYNHGQDAHSLPSSPLLFREHNNYDSTGEHNPTAASHMELPEKFLKTNNNIHEYNMKGTTIANGHVMFSVDSGDSLLESETEESQGRNISFFKGDMTTALLLRARTTPASPNDTPHVLSCNTTIQQDPVAV